METGNLKINLGYFGLGDFIALDNKLQEDLLQISDVVYNYASQKKHVRPLNIYIEASPGAGKSFFVKQIIKSALLSLDANIKFVSKTFNLTTIDSPRELKDAFRIVQSINIDEKLPIVFFDEVDSKIGNEYDAYPTFLSPMFDGKIFDKGNEYSIGNGIFFFAASKKLKDQIRDEPNSPPPQKEVDNTTPYEDWIKTELEDFESAKEILGKKDSPNKLKDFLDRIDNTVFLPPPSIRPNGNLNDQKRQSLYFAASFLLKHYPNIQSVDSRVLAILGKTLLKNRSMRVLDSIIINSSPPFKGVFKPLNLPNDFRNENKHYFDLVQDSQLLNVIK